MMIIRHLHFENRGFLYHVLNITSSNFCTNWNELNSNIKESEAVLSNMFNLFIT